MLPACDGRHGSHPGPAVASPHVRTGHRGDGARRWRPSGHGRGIRRTRAPIVDRDRPSRRRGPGRAGPDQAGGRTCGARMAAPPRGRQPRARQPSQGGGRARPADRRERPGGDPAGTAEGRRRTRLLRRGVAQGGGASDARRDLGRDRGGAPRAPGGHRAGGQRRRGRSGRRSRGDRRGIHPGGRRVPPRDLASTGDRNAGEPASRRRLRRPVGGPRSG